MSLNQSVAVKGPRRRNGRRRARVVLTLLAALVFAVVPGGMTADGTWDGGGSQAWGQAIWGGTANWNPDGVIASGTSATATFGIAFTNGYNVIVNTARTIGHIVFNEPADANDLTLGKHTNDYILTLDVTNGAPTAPTIKVNQAGRTLTIFPKVGGTDGLAKIGPGNLVLSNANLYTGPTTIQAGRLTLGDALAIQNSVLDTAGSVAGNTTNGLRTTVTALTLGGLSGNKNFASMFTTTAGSFETMTSLTLNPGPGVTNTYSGNITNGAAGMTLSKTGGGVQVLGGTNTYTGPTTISAGALRVNGALAVASTMTVQPGGTLGGNGIVSGATTVNGVVAPGADGAGVLTFQNGLNLTGGGTFRWELTTLKDDSTGVAGTDFDRVALTGGPLALSSAATLAIEFTGAATSPDTAQPFWQSNHTWRIVTLSGTASNPGAFNFGALSNAAFSAGTFSTAVTNDAVLLHFTPAVSAPALVVLPTNVTVLEGSSNTFSVRLSAAPTNMVTVTTTFSSGDADLGLVSGNTLQFDATNWATPQPVTLNAAEDADSQNSQALFTVSAPGASSLVVTATEADNDGSWLTNRPNFVIMCTDDQRWDAMGAVQRERGALARFPWFQSPNLDRLADGGVRFRNAFVVHSLCSPSRATMLSGRYGHLNGVINNSTAFPTNSVTWATLLGAAGYVNGYIGKWHMGSQSARPGFQYAASYLDQGSYNNNNFIVNGVTTNITGWVDDVSTDFATNFITANRTNSFALFVGYKSAHNPITPPARLTNLYVTNFAGPILNSNALPPWSTNTTYATEATMRDYHRCIYGVDENVGRILNLLDQLNLASNTVVMFLSDNGRYLGEHAQGDKRSAYEESLRIPFLLRYPARVGASNLNDSLVLNLDLAPTILEYAGLPVPAAMQGRPIGPLLQGQTTGWRTSFFYEYFLELGSVPNLYAIRTTTNKWIHYVGHPEWSELFLMAEDPFETNNLAFNPAYAAQRSLMESALREQMDTLGLLARMQSFRRTNNTLQFDLVGGYGPVWQLETSTNLLNWLPWTSVRMNVFTGDGAKVPVSDTNPAMVRKFYRGSIRSN